MDLNNRFPDWVEDGVSAGWVGCYEREQLEFLSEEFGQLPDGVVSAVVFTSLFLKAGHVCLPLDKTVRGWAFLLGLDGEDPLFSQVATPDPEGLLRHPAIGENSDETPYVLDNGHLFIRRNWIQEFNVANRLKSLSSYEFEIDDIQRAADLLNDLYPGGEGDNWQKAAAALALRKQLLIISGGPGTGKTTTVARIIRLLQQMNRGSFKVGLAAPTGKAAARMSSSLHQDPGVDTGLSAQEDAVTIHRLLQGMSRDGMLPVADRRMLPFDLIVIDEASMVDLPLMERLLRHIGERTRLILLGDRHQLSSVEAGAVLADICQKESNRFAPSTTGFLQSLNVKTQSALEQSNIEDSIIYLTKSWRFDAAGGIADLAGAVNGGHSTDAVQILENPENRQVTFRDFEYRRNDLKLLVSEAAARVAQTEDLTERELPGYWAQSIWLGVLRRGPAGTEALNRLIEEQLTVRRIIQPVNGWYQGRPVLVTRNDYSTGVFNGDMGVCVVSDKGSPEVLFTGPAGELKRVAAHRLTEYEPAYLLTVHKSQGSEFDSVKLLLPDRDTPILTRELIYTAITRTREHFYLFGNRDLLVKGIERQTERFTGLVSHLHSDACI